MKRILDGPGGKLSLIVLQYGKGPGILWIHGGGYVLGMAAMVYYETLTYIRNLKEAGIEAAVDVFHGKTHGFDFMFWTKKRRKRKKN